MRNIQVIITRGLPGSGKSCLAHLLAAEFGLKSLICSADHWFERSGEYKFDWKQLGRAHLECRKAFLEGIQRMLVSDKIYDLVIVDNTNTTPVEIAFYQELASLFTSDIKIYHVVPPGYKKPNCNHLREREPSEVHLAWIRDCHRRNQHGVPLDKIEQMWGRIHENKLPWHWKEEKVVRQEGYFAFKDRNLMVAT